MLTPSWGFVKQLGMWFRHDPDCQSVNAQEPWTSLFALLAEKKQLVDSQIGVNSITSREGRYVSLIRLYPSCNTGEIQAINAGSRCAHKFTVQIVDGGIGKMVKDKYIK